LSYILIDTGPMVCLMRVPSMRVLNRLPISSWLRIPGHVNNVSGGM
jgi:hypothetical protein